MTKTIIVAIGFCSIILCVIFSTPAHAENNSSTSTNEKNIYKNSAELENRLNSLEPPKPITFLKSPEQKETEGRYPSKTFSISEVLSKGKNPFQYN